MKKIKNRSIQLLVSSKKIGGKDYILFGPHFFLEGKWFLAFVNICKKFKLATYQKGCFRQINISDKNLSDIIFDCECCGFEILYSSDFCRKLVSKTGYQKEILKLRDNYRLANVINHKHHVENSEHFFMDNMDIPLLLKNNQDAIDFKSALELVENSRYLWIKERTFFVHSLEKLKKDKKALFFKLARIHHFIMFSPLSLALRPVKLFDFYNLATGGRYNNIKEFLKARCRYVITDKKYQGIF